MTRFLVVDLFAEESGVVRVESWFVEDDDVEDIGVLVVDCTRMGRIDVEAIVEP